MDNTTNKKYQDNGWESMKAILDSEMPEKKRRILPIFWLFPSVAASLFLVFWMFNVSPKVDDTRQDQLTENEKNSENTNNLVLNTPSTVTTHNKSEASISPNTPNHDNITKNQSNFDLGVNHTRSRSTKNVNPLNLAKNLTILRNDNSEHLKDSSYDVISTNQNQKDKKPEEIVTNVISDQKRTEQNSHNNSEPSAITNSKQSSFIDHAVVQENDIDNNLSDATVSPNSIVENEPLSIETLQPIKHFKLALEAGFNKDLNSNFTGYTIGGRYVIKSTKNIDFLISAGGYYIPNDIKYTYTYLSDMMPGFASNVNVGRTVNYMMGIRSIAQINYNLSSLNGLYLFGGIGALSNWTIDTNNKKTADLQTSRDKIEDTTSGTKLNYKKINFLGQVGIGYTKNHFGIELFYRPTQNTLRNSGLVGLNQKWTHQVGINGLYFF